MNEALGLRERKKRERRRCIEDAAIQLFETRGFDATTIGDIAAAADIAPRTFFSYFPTKEDVVLADYAERLARIVDVLAEQPATDPPWHALEAAFVTVAADYVSSRDALIRRFGIMAANPSVYARSLQLQTGWEEALTVALQERTGNATNAMGPRLLASAALACMRSSLQHWLLTGHREALPDLVQACFSHLGSGLAATDR